MNKQRIDELVGAFADKRILVVGDVMLDQYVKGRVERLNPEAPVPVLHAQEESAMSGGAGNVAKNVASLGGVATLVGVVGNDETGNGVMAAATAEGYAAQLITDDSRPTTLKARYVVGGQQLLRVDWEVVEDVSAAVTKKIMAATQAAVTAGVGAIIVSDYAKGAVTEALASALLDIAKRAKIPLAADVKPSRVAYFKGATMIAPNLKEAHEYLGLNHLEQGGRPAAELARELHQKFSTDVFLTLSSDGVYVVTSDGVDEQVKQAHTIAVADTSGAGDTFIAAAILARLSGATPVEMAEIANAAGAVVVSKIGAVGVTAEEVANMLTHHHEV